MDKEYAICLEFSRNYEAMTKNVEKKMPLIYRFMRSYSISLELNNGYILKKINKSTSKGTVLYFKRIENSEIYNSELAKMEIELKEIKVELERAFEEKFDEQKLN